MIETTLEPSTYKFVPTTFAKYGLFPTDTVATTASVLVSITETSSESMFSTYKFAPTMLAKYG